jgi:hypothetical protein
MTARITAWARAAPPAVAAAPAAPGAAEGRAPAQPAKFSNRPQHAHPCSYTRPMAAITIRNVPEELRDELVARAARAGLPLERYLLWGLAMMVDDPCTDIHAVQED